MSQHRPGGYPSSVSPSRETVSLETLIRVQEWPEGGRNVSHLIKDALVRSNPQAGIENKRKVNT